MTAMVQMRLAISAVLLSLLSVAPVASAKSLQAATTVPPLAWLVDEIAGDAAGVTVMVPEGHVPESSQPSPGTLLQLRSAGIVILVGHPAFTFEIKYVVPHLSEQQQADSINLYRLAQLIYPDFSIDEDDPHLWTSPLVMREAAKQLADILARQDPDHADMYRGRSTALIMQLDQLIERFHSMVTNRGSKRFVVYHPAWGSLERDFQLEQVSIEHHGKAPGPAGLARMLDDFRHHGDKVIITSPGHAQRDAAVIASQLDGEIVVVDPLLRDWDEMMENVMSALAGGKVQ